MLRPAHAKLSSAIVFKIAQMGVIGVIVGKLGVPIFHCPWPIEIDEMSVMRLQYVSYLIPILLLLRGDSNAEGEP
jgi:hypothetical protein